MEKISKSKVRFEITYNVNLLHRTARLYMLLAVVTIVALLVGTTLLALIVFHKGENGILTMVAWLVAGYAAYVMFFFRPIKKSEEYEDDAEKYKRLLPMLNHYSAEAMNAVLIAVRVDDKPTLTFMRNIAYNETVIDMERSDAALELTAWQKVVIRLTD